jgi:hypothetical protein
MSMYDYLVSRTSFMEDHGCIRILVAAVEKTIGRSGSV